MRKLADDCGEHLGAISLSDSRIWVLDGDLADSDGAEQFTALHRARFLQCGIGEQSMVTTAAGMAAVGARPWVFSFAAFLCCRAYDQIRTSVSLTHLPVTLVGSHAGGLGGRNGKSHIIINDIALISTLPQIAIWSPADAEDVKQCVDLVLCSSSAAYIRLPRTPLTVIGSDPSIIRWFGEPTEIAIVAHGLATHWALEVQALLVRQNVGISVVQVLQIWPLASEIIAEIASIRVACVVEDHSILGGFGSLLKCSGFKGEILSFGWPINWTGQSGTDDALRLAGGLSAAQLAVAIAKVLEDGSGGQEAATQQEMEGS